MTMPLPDLNHFYELVVSRRGSDPLESYVARLFSKGTLKIAQKVGEEAVETGLAAAAQGPKDVINESADLLFHLIILWAACGVTPDDVMHEMQRREGISGLSEKAGRNE